MARKSKSASPTSQSPPACSALAASGQVAGLKSYFENIFAVLKRNIEQRRPSTADELEEAIHEEWANIPDELCKKAIRSMPARLQAVRDANSHATGY